MKKVALVVLGLEYVIYLLLFFTILLPSVKSYINQSFDKSWAYMGYSMIILPLLLGLFLCYKCYTAESPAGFWTYFILAIILPLLAFFVNMFFLM
jgi:hypothetical protein